MSACAHQQQTAKVTTLQELHIRTLVSRLTRADLGDATAPVRNPGSRDLMKSIHPQGPLPFTLTLKYGSPPTPILLHSYTEVRGTRKDLPRAAVNAISPRLDESTTLQGVTATAAVCQLYSHPLLIYTGMNLCCVLDIFRTAEFCFLK